MGSEDQKCPKIISEDEHVLRWSLMVGITTKDEFDRAYQKLNRKVVTDENNRKYSLVYALLEWSAGTWTVINKIMGWRI